MTSMADRRPTFQWDKGDPDLELPVTSVDHMSVAKVENIPCNEPQDHKSVRQGSKILNSNNMSDILPMKHY